MRTERWATSGGKIGILVAVLISTQPASRGFPVAAAAASCSRLAGAAAQHVSCMSHYASPTR